MCLLVFATLFGVFLDAGDALQIQCYQCEEVKHNDCSTPEYIVNCTVNVQDMCQKEVLVKPDGGHCCDISALHFPEIKQCGQCCDICFVAANGTRNVCNRGIHYRKSCASSGACLIASSGYQQFCTGRINSVCISCCNTPLCNGPKRKRPVPSAATSSRQTLSLALLPLLVPMTVLPAT